MTQITTNQKNTFTGANLVFPNEAIHAFLAQIIKFRKQLTVRPEFRSQSGWNNAVNSYMEKELEALSDTIEVIAYNPDGRSQEEIEADASNTSGTLADRYGRYTLSTDNLMMPPTSDSNVVWTLDGGDPDIPQMTPMACPNDWARIFITALDSLFVQSTRLDSRFEATHIARFEAAVLMSYLERLYAITQRAGGEANRSDTPAGTLPSQDPYTFNFENQPSSAMPERITETGLNVKAARHDNPA